LRQEARACISFCRFWRRCLDLPALWLPLVL